MIFTQANRLTARFFTALVALSLILSALPLSLFVAEAIELPFPVCEDPEAINTGLPLPCDFPLSKGSIEITKYACPADTPIVRSVNGVDGIVPAACALQSDMSFGYVHGENEGNGDPYDDILGHPFTEAGITDVNGVLTIPDLDASGRYLIAETDGAGNKLPNEDIIDLYCEGDGASDDNEHDNQELTFFDAGETAHCVAYNIAPEVPDTHSSETIVITGDTSAGENLSGWLFNRDLGNATPIEFNTDEISIGSGSLNVLPLGLEAARKFIGEYFFFTPIAEIISVSYDFKIGTGGVDADANEFYMNVYANYGESSATNYYDCKYDVVPTVGSTGSFTTVTFDPTQSYNVTTSGSSSYGCPSVPADMDIQNPGSTIRMFALNMGDITDGDAGLDGYFDNVVTVVDEGVDIHTTTFDFEPLQIPEETPVCEIGENLLVNASFEDPVISSSWSLGTIANWIVTKVVDATGIDGEIWRNFNGTGPDFASDGAQNVELDSSASTKLTQNIVTVPGATYELRFDFSPRKGTGLADNNVDATADGAVVVNASGDGSELDENTWSTHSGTFVATDSSTEISFTDNGAANGVGSLLDNTVLCYMSDPAPIEASLMITNPITDGLTLEGEHTFEAEYVDADSNPDNIFWAIRGGTCAASTGTVAGNVDGHTDSSSFIGTLFSTTVDMSTWDDGEYCFVVNPQEDGGTDFRETRTFTLDNPEPTPPVPEPIVGAYCGDGVVNQEWEQCDAGLTGGDVEGGTCEATCQFANQCVEVNLAKITLEETNSVSFDDTVYLGSALNQIPNGAWFNVDEIGDDAASTIANNSEGLAVERDTINHQLKFAFVGGNGGGYVDKAIGSIELYGTEVGTINRQLNPQFKLENGSGGSFSDYFFTATSSTTVIDFDLRTDTGNDGVILGLKDADICVYEAPTYTINGYKFNDTNSNGVQDIEELTLSGWVIQLLDGEDDVVATTTTDESGHYSFIVEGGSWKVQEVQQVGWTQTAPSLGYCQSIYFNIESSSTDSCSFGNHQDEVIETFIGGGNGKKISLSSTRSGQVLGASTSTVPAGQVLGASTDTQCGMFLSDYMKQGSDNKVFEVQKLQAFLLSQGYYGVHLTGMFDNLTTHAVQVFQATYSTDILKPWVDASLMTEEYPTGLVYKTTRWKINELVCPGSEAFPVLP